MIVFIKAKELIEHTMILTDNTNHYPKKARFSFVNRMQDLSISIYENLLTANEMDLRDEKEKEKRICLLRDTLTKCKILSFFIELSYNKNYIDGNSCVYWQKKVDDVRNLTAALLKKNKAV